MLKLGHRKDQHLFSPAQLSDIRESYHTLKHSSAAALQQQYPEPEGYHSTNRAQAQRSPIQQAPGGRCSAFLYSSRAHGSMEAPQVQIDTSMGSFTVELYYKHAPRTVKNFVELSKRGYYDGTKFHRIIRDFMIQGGDPTGTGRGGESIYGGKFEDELHPELRHTGAGILSMANSGRDTNGSQFFVTLAPTPFLDGKHTIFGRVSHGMSVMKRLGNVQTDATDRPTTDVKILRARPVE